MANRQQRRATSKIQNDPKVKAFTDRFAMDLSKILVNHFDKTAVAMENNEKVDLSFDEATKDILKEKGAEFGKFFEDFAKDVKNDSDFKDRQRQQQKQQLRVTIR